MRLLALAVLVSTACASTEQQPPPQAPEPKTAPPLTYDQVPEAEPAPPAPVAEEDRPRADRPPRSIYRSELDRAIGGGPGYLLYQLGPEPFRVSGRFVGWEITKLFPDDPKLCAPGCDLEIGDVILMINGSTLETPQAFGNLVSTADKMKKLEVRSLRNEKRRVVTYRIVED